MRRACAYDSWMLLRQWIGHRIRTLRTARGLSLRDLNRLANVSPAHLSEIERGRSEPSSEILASICDALDVSLAELLATLPKTAYRLAS